MLKPTQLLLLTTLLLLGACSPLSKNADATAYTAEVVDPDEIKCQRVIKTGSRIGTKVCRTNRTWEALAARGREDLERSRRRAGHATTYDTGGSN